VSVGRGVRLGGPGVWGGTGELRIQRHIEDHAHRHLKRVAERAFEFFTQKQCDLLIIAGPEDKTIPYLVNHLHSYLRERLAGEFHARPEMPIATLKERAVAVAQTWERRYEEQLIARLLEQAHAPNGLAVLGVEPTLEALMSGQVHTLVLQHDFRVQGTLCPNDHFLSSYLTECPLCHNRMHPTDDLADEMIEEAIHQNAEIEHVFTRHDQFAPHGVGAILRFR
jgi:peptide subunit release factor 1 (eRF1)